MCRATCSTLSHIYTYTYRIFRVMSFPAGSARRGKNRKWKDVSRSPPSGEREQVELWFYSLERALIKRTRIRQANRAAGGRALFHRPATSPPLSLPRPRSTRSVGIFLSLVVVQDDEYIHPDHLLHEAVARQPRERETRVSRSLTALCAMLSSSLFPLPPPV